MYNKYLNIDDCDIEEMKYEVECFYGHDVGDYTNREIVQMFIEIRDNTIYDESHIKYNER